MCRGRYNVEYTVNAGARCLLHVFGASGVRFLLFFVCLVFLLIFLVPLGTFGSLFCLLSSTNWVPLGSGWAKIATIFIFFTQTLTAGGGRLCFLVWVWTQPPPPGMSLVGYVPVLRQFHAHPAQRFLLVILLQTESLSLFYGKSAFIVGHEFSALSISSKESTVIGVSSPGWCPPSACLGLASPPLQAVSH